MMQCACPLAVGMPCRSECRELNHGETSGCGLGLHRMLIDVSDIDAGARPQPPIELLESFACDAEWQLLTGPIGPDDRKHRIALVYSGKHYDAVRLPFGSWDALQQQQV